MFPDFAETAALTKIRIREMSEKIACCRLAAAAMKAQQRTNQSRLSKFVILCNKWVRFWHIPSQPSSKIVAKQANQQISEKQHVLNFKLPFQKGNVQ